MIVEPDFLDHWKTRLFTELAETPTAPLMVLRLWAHCQQRKRWKFDNLDCSALRVICHTEIDGAELKSYLVQAGFVKEEGKFLVIHDWEKANRMLVSAWKNGLKGGRPIQTGGKPDKNQSANRQGTCPSSLSYLSNLSSERVRERFKEWIPVRKAQGKAPKNWDTMFAEQVKWLGKFGESDQLESISASIRNNWQGLFPPKSNGQYPKTDSGRPKIPEPIGGWKK